MYISRYLLGNLGDAESGQLSSNRFPSDMRSDALIFGANLQRKLGWEKGEVLPVFSPNSIDISYPLYTGAVIGLEVLSHLPTHIHCRGASSLIVEQRYWLFTPH